MYMVLERAIVARCRIDLVRCRIAMVRWRIDNVRCHIVIVHCRLDIVCGRIAIGYPSSLFALPITLSSPYPLPDPNTIPLRAYCSGLATVDHKWIAHAPRSQ